MYPRRRKETLVEKQVEMRSRLASTPASSLPHAGHVQHHQEQLALSELATRWGLSAKTLRRLFDREAEGVIRVGTDKITMFVSDSAARRVYARLSHR